MPTSSNTAPATTKSAPKGYSLWELVGAMIALRRQRRALRTLDDEQLSDIGVTREEADAESRRPLWDAPAHWFHS